ncbi:hypothetical protein Tco_0990045, partial [Tanacetum coccineum]
WKGVVRFGKRGKLNPRYVRPFKVLEKVGSVVYKLELPQELSRVHNAFQVSNLKKCYSEEPLVVPLEGLHVDDKLHFVEEPVEIMDREVKWFKQSRILIVKVRWNSRRGPEFTWEREDQFQKKIHLCCLSADGGDDDDEPSDDDDDDDDTDDEDEEPFEDEEDDEEEEHLAPADSSAIPVVDSDPDKDLEEDPEEDHADYPIDRGDDDDEPSNDDHDDTDDEDEEPFEDEGDDKEEEEHLALADSFVIPVVDHVPSARDTKALETDESAPTPRAPQIRIPFAQTRLRRAQKTVSLEPPMSPSMEARIAEYVVAPTPPSPPPSPLSPWLSPLPQIPSPPLHVSSPPLPLPPPTIDSPTYAEAPLGYRAAGIRLRVSSPSTHNPLHPLPPHLPPPVPTSLPLPLSPLPPLLASLSIPLLVDRREDILEAELPPRKRLCPTAPTSRYEVEESSTAAPRPTGGHRADYGFIGTMDAEIRLDGLVEDRQFHYETTRLLDQEAFVSREDWVHSVGLSLAVHYELQAYRTHSQMQDYRIASQESLMMTLIAHVSSLQGQLLVALRQIQALQARDQTHADDPKGDGSSA